MQGVKSIDQQFSLPRGQPPGFDDLILSGFMHQAPQKKISDYDV
jgi:hypothetical protein